MVLELFLIEQKRIIYYILYILIFKFYDFECRFRLPEDRNRSVGVIPLNRNTQIDVQTTGNKNHQNNTTMR